MITLVSTPFLALFILGSNASICRPHNWKYTSDMAQSIRNGDSQLKPYANYCPGKQRAISHGVGGLAV
jgi:hypothetical protein